MRKHSFLILLSLLLVACPLLTNAETSKKSTDVSAARSSNFTITIPKKINMAVTGSDGRAGYRVSCQGDLAATDRITVTPPANFNMSSGSSNLVASISQDRNYFDLNMMSDLSGDIRVSGLTAGDWVGHFYFNIDCTISDITESTEGSENEVVCDHSFEYADCVSLGVCTLCGAETTEPKGHVYEGHECFCDYCGSPNPEVTLVADPYSNQNYKQALCNHGIASVYGSGAIYNEFYFDKSLVNEIIVADGITEIGGFSNCVNLTKVDLGNTCNTIRLRAFQGCTSLKASDILSEGTTSIGDQAFSGCSSLGEVVIPKSVTYIGNNAFSDTGVTKLVIQKDLTAGRGVFYNSREIEELELLEGVTTLADGINFQYASKLKTVKLPSTLKSIGSAAFYETGIEELDLPEGLETIGGRAFSTCRSLKSLSIPDSVTTLGDSLFEGCSGLEEVKLPSTLESIPNNCFYSCTKLTKVDIPEGVSSLGNSAFYSTTNLNEVSLPSDLVSIGSSCFQNSKLSSINLPQTLESIGANAFAGSSLSNVTIPGTVTNIGSSLFSTCSNLSRVEFGEGITKVPDSCFYATNSFELILPSTIKSIEQYAFRNSGVLSVDLKNVESLGKNAFWNATNLTEITIPSTVTSMGDGVFSGCSKLASITLLNNLEEIPTSCFSGTAITDIELPSSCTIIGNNAFSSCSKLASFDISPNITTIGNYAFSGCSSLKSIVIPNTVVNLGESIFNVSGLEQITLPDNMTEIPKGFFSGSNLVSIDIPDSVKVINDNAFMGCKKLTSVSLPETLDSIKQYAFQECILLNLTVPDNVSLIGTSAFKNVPSVTYRGTYAEGAPWGAKQLITE